MSVSLIARQHGIAPNQVFTWRRLYAEGALLAVGAGEEVVPASEYRALQHQVHELERLLGKKTLENEVRRDALECGTPEDSEGCRPRIRDDVAHHSDLISPGVPR
jgi:transposase-like protein